MKKIVVLLVTVACLTSALDIHALPVPEATAEPELANEPELTADELEPIVEPEPVVIVLTEADVAHLRTKVVINGVEMWQSITGEIIPVDQPIKITVAERIEEKKMADAAAAVAEREAQRKEMQEARKVEVLLKTAVPVKLEREAIREEFQEDLENTLQQAVYTHKSGFSLQADLRVSFRSHERIKRQYIALQTRRRQEQRLIFELEDEIKALEDKNNLKLHASPDARQHLEEQKEALAEFVRHIYQQESAIYNVGPSKVPRGIQFALQGSLGDAVEYSIYNRAMHRVREELLYHVESLQDRPVLYELRKKNLANIEAEILELQPEYAKAREELLTLKSRVNEVADIAASIRGEVLQLQKEMSAFEASQGSKGKELSFRDTGLEDSMLRELETDIFLFDNDADFIWPVHGPVSAEFRSLSYQRLFGVPHNAMDIAVPQYTAVRAVADGIVYTTRDGGQHGYSYMLIGHGNYASLYGHLYQMLVPPGTLVKKGDIIARSGGTPGTWGAGQMTTGAHLHFEMFKDGQHINPRRLLPNMYASAE